FGIGLGTVITLDLVAIVITGRVIEPPELSALTSGAAAWLWVLLAVHIVVLQPVAEELVFRGVLFPALAAAQNVWLSIFVSGALYGFFHQLLYTYPAQDVAFGWWYTLAEPLIAGVVFSFLRAGTGSTGAAIAAHVGVGVFGLLKTMLIVGVLS
ncbi:MAG: CPBP family intramembrane glutamic endopeptidase, partial [Chloroflexota bacterium]